MNEPLDPGDIRNTRPADARPFIVAFIGFVIVAVAAFYFLREDGDLSIVRPVRVAVVDDTTVRFAIPVPEDCADVVRVQVDLSDSERVFVEAIVDDSGCSGGPEVEVDLQVLLPQPIDGRRRAPPVGRVEIPCDPSGTCRADR